MTRDIVLILIATFFSNVTTWVVATYRATSKQEALQRDFELHQTALALTDKRLRFIMRTVVDLANQAGLTIRAGDLLEMNDVLGGD